MTLTEAADFTRKSVYFILIPIGVIILVWMLIGVLQKAEPLPDKYLTADYMCGPLEPLQIEALDSTSGGQLSIETTSGAIPDLPQIVNVYEYNHPGQSLLALQEAQYIAELLGFDKENYRRISTVEYQWYDSEKKRTLTIEVGNLNISMTTDYSASGIDTNPSTLPSEENAKTIALEYLQKANLLTRDFSRGEQKTYLIQITPSGEFREAPSLSEADLIRVDFFREKDLITIDPELVGEELGTTLQEQLEQEDVSTIETEDDGSVNVKKYTTDVYDDNPIFGNISVYVGGTTEENPKQNEIYSLEYRNWILGSIACGTYDLISPQEAVQKVQEGDASLVHLMEKGGDRIVPYEMKTVEQMTILEVSLGYLDKNDKQTYMQPVFVIRGEANFGGDVYGEFYYYVPAINYDAIPSDAGTVPVETDTTTTE